MLAADLNRKPEGEKVAVIAEFVANALQRLSLGSTIEVTSQVFLKTVYDCNDLTKGPYTSAQKIKKDYREVFRAASQEGTALPKIGEVFQRIMSGNADRAAMAAVPEALIE